MYSIQSNIFTEGAANLSESRYRKATGISRLGFLACRESRIRGRGARITAGMGIKVVFTLVGNGDDHYTLVAKVAP